MPMGGSGSCGWGLGCESSEIDYVRCRLDDVERGLWMHPLPAASLLVCFAHGSTWQYMAVHGSADRWQRQCGQKQ